VFWDRCKDADRAGGGCQSEGLIKAPEDCRGSSGLRWLLAEGRRQMRFGCTVLTIDLSRVRRMNSGLLATVLLLVREAARAGRRLHLEGASEEFRNWARTFSLLETLESRGVMADSPLAVRPVLHA